MNIKDFLTVQKILILSYRILLGLSLLGVFLAPFNFGYGPVCKAPVPTVNVSSINWTRDFFEREEYQAYYHYVQETEDYGTYLLVPSFYVMLPCGVGMLFAGVFVLVDLLSKDIVETTVGLYSSFGLLSMVVGFTGAYQHRSEYLPKGYENFILSYNWITAIHSLMLILLILQIILSIRELCRQNVRWPTIHFSHFFTIGMVARAVLLIFATYLSIAFFVSVLEGYRFGGYDDPVFRYPEYFFMPCAVACLYGVLVAFEAFTSQIFGHVHDKMMGISGLVMSAGYAVVGIIFLPPITSDILSENISDPVLIFSWVCFSVSLIYAGLCLVVPRALNTPPAIIRYLAYGMSHMKCWGHSTEVRESEACNCKNIKIFRKIAALWENLKKSDSLRTNMILMILSFLCIVLISAEWTYNASCVIMLFSDIAIFYRAFPALVSELSSNVCPVVQPLQIICLYVLETMPLFVGLIYNYFTLHSGAILTANILNIIVIIFQLYKVQTYPEVKAEIRAMLEAKNPERGKVQASDDEQPLHKVTGKPDDVEGNEDSVPSD
ncbi:uncharacterized protein LOC125033418 [Penaeus chinensis]|uniref:uncharacterized protein LOC125033418 n=1 Tax=Penaeus chinensis TaxID=139456 RepID=UPI001FB83508|nr:uncharacterized protein LOC125033418 [Penaeus chinensis]